MSSDAASGAASGLGRAAVLVSCSVCILSWVWRCSTSPSHTTAPRGAELPSSPQHRTRRRRRRMSADGVDAHWAGNVDHPMNVLPMRDFLLLEVLPTSNELLASGKLVQVTDQSSIVHFISHQWLGEYSVSCSTAGTVTTAGCREKCGRSEWGTSGNDARCVQADHRW